VKNARTVRKPNDIQPNQAKGNVCLDQQKPHYIMYTAERFQMLQVFSEEVMLQGRHIMVGQEKGM
jgi:hypothetical protein